MAIKGKLERVSCGTVYGWAVDDKRLENRQDIQVYVDGELIGELPASQKRGDLLSNKIGNGEYGFSLAVPDKYYDGRITHIHAFTGITGCPLPNSPLVVKFLPGGTEEVIEADTLRLHPVSEWGKHFYVQDEGQHNYLQTNIDTLTRKTKPNIAIEGSNNFVFIGNHTFLDRVDVKIRGHNNKVYIHENCRLRQTQLRFSGHHNTIVIGAGTTIEEAKLICQETRTSIQLGKDCMLSEGIVMRTSDSHSILDLDTKERINHAADITIDDHVWIGREAHINKGVHIHTGSIVASRAIVTRDVPPHTAVGGVPAKVVRERIAWDRALL